MKNGLITLLLVALVATGAWGYLQYQEKNDYHTYLDNQFQRMFYDLTASAETISTDISKILVSSQRKENVALYSNILLNAYNAQEKLSQLPIKHREVTKIEKFLNQVGDYAFALSRKSLSGETLSDEEVNNLEKLHNYSMELSTDLHDIQKEALSGHAWKGELKRKGNELNDDAEKESPIQTKFIKFEERMVEYPELIYDGPFSELAQAIQVEQYQMLKTCLGREFFNEHHSALLRATRGMVYLKRMDLNEFYNRSRELQKSLENL